jgi:transposase
MKFILGIDIAKDKFDCCLLFEGRKLHQEFLNDRRGFKQLLRWLHKAGAAPAELWACMEATGIYGETLLRFLFASGLKVSKVNPAQIKYYAHSLLSRNKTDRQDAFIIAEFARERSATGQLRLWQPPSPAIARLRQLTRLLAARKGQRAREKRRAKMVDPILRVHTRAMLRAFQKQIEAIQAQIDALIASGAELKRRYDLLRTIPCVGPVTAQTVLAELPEQIANARAAAAYAGVTPRREDSGQKKGRARLSKTGNTHLRQALYMPASSGRKTNPRLQACAQRLADKGKTRKQAIGACMHLLLRLCVGVMASGKAFDPHWQKQAAC